MPVAARIMPMKKRFLLMSVSIAAELRRVQVIRLIGHKPESSAARSSVQPGDQQRQALREVPSVKGLGFLKTTFLKFPYCQLFVNRHTKA